MFEAGASLTEKAEEKRKRLQNVYIFVGLTAGKQNVRERESMCAVSVSHSLREWVLGRRKYIYIYIYILIMQSAPNARDKIKVADVVVSTNHMTFLTNRFPRLISLPTSAIFVSRTSGITDILKYRSVESYIYIFFIIYSLQSNKVFILLLLFFLFLLFFLNTLVSLFYSIWSFVGYLMTKTSL